jgi:hypothetical protein
LKKLSSAEVSSLLSRSAARHQEQAQQPAGMSLDQFYISLGEASKADWQAGLITETQFWNRVAELKGQYRALKSR